MSTPKQQVLLMSLDWGTYFRYGGSEKTTDNKYWDDELLEQGLTCNVISAAQIPEHMLVKFGEMRRKSRYLVYAITPDTIRQPVLLINHIVHAACLRPDQTLVLLSDLESGYDDQTKKDLGRLSGRLVGDGAMVFATTTDLAAWLNDPHNWIVRDEVWTPFEFYCMLGGWDVMSRNQWEGIKHKYYEDPRSQGHDVYDSRLIQVTEPGKLYYGQYVAPERHLVAESEKAAGRLAKRQPASFDLEGPTLREFFEQHGMVVD